jgi:hypothetical protein
MAMRRHASTVIAASLALAGCSREIQELKQVTAPTLCNAKDSDGRFYEATNIEPLNALEDALSRCTLTSRDPTSCQKVACAPVQ